MYFKDRLQKKKTQLLATCSTSVGRSLRKKVSYPTAPVLV